MELNDESAWLYKPLYLSERDMRGLNLPSTGFVYTSRNACTEHLSSLSFVRQNLRFKKKTSGVMGSTYVCVPLAGVCPGMIKVAFGKGVMVSGEVVSSEPCVCPLHAKVSLKTLMETEWDSVCAWRHAMLCYAMLEQGLCVVHVRKKDPPQDYGHPDNPKGTATRIFCKLNDGNWFVVDCNKAANGRFCSNHPYLTSFGRRSGQLTQSVPSLETIKPLIEPQEAVSQLQNMDSVSTQLQHANSLGGDSVTPRREADKLHLMDQCALQCGEIGLYFWNCSVCRRPDVNGHFDATINSDKVLCRSCLERWALERHGWSETVNEKNWITPFKSTASKQCLCCRECEVTMYADVDRNHGKPFPEIDWWRLHFPLGYVLSRPYFDHKERDRLAYIFRKYVFPKFRVVQKLAFEEQLTRSHIEVCNNDINNAATEWNLNQLRSEALSLETSLKKIVANLRAESKKIPEWATDITGRTIIPSEDELKEQAKTEVELKATFQCQKQQSVSRQGSLYIDDSSSSDEDNDEDASINIFEVVAVVPRPEQVATRAHSASLQASSSIQQRPLADLAVSPQVASRPGGGGASETIDLLLSSDEEIETWVASSHDNSRKRSLDD